METLITSLIQIHAPAAVQSGAAWCVIRFGSDCDHRRSECRKRKKKDAELSSKKGQKMAQVCTDWSSRKPRRIQSDVLYTIANSAGPAKNRLSRYSKPSGESGRPSGKHNKCRSVGTGDQAEGSFFGSGAAQRTELWQRANVGPCRGSGSAPSALKTRWVCDICLTLAPLLIRRPPSRAGQFR
jgi:hypothetical protein